MGIVQLLSPASIHAAIEKRWDEVDPQTRTFVAPNAIVSGMPWNYLLDDDVHILVNEQPAQGCRRDCSDTDFDCNFWLGDAILVATDPSPSSDAVEATIRLEFSARRARGRRLDRCQPRRSVSTKPFFDQPLLAAMWIALESDPLTCQPGHRQWLDWSRGARSAPR